jgi:tetratricopeptide (TPR) repeat protein
MTIDPIFLNSDWDAAAQTLFWETLKKKRGQKLMYVSKKANNLTRNNKLQESNSLLQHFVEDYLANEKTILAKDKYPRLYINDIADFCLKISSNYNKLNNPEKAEEQFLLAAKIYESYPNDPDLCARRAFDGYLNMADIFIALSEAKKAETYLSIYEKKLDKNDNKYPLALCRSRLAGLSGNWTKADKLWVKFYKDFSNHKTHLDLENHPYINVMGQAEADPVSSGEAIIVYHHCVIPVIFAKDRTALEKLDGLLKGIIKTNAGEDYSFYGYKVEFTHKHFLPELGAYLGEVWVNSLGGKWILDPLLMKSRVEIKGKIYNPFEFAYKALYWQYRLQVECFDRISNL